MIDASSISEKFRVLWQDIQDLGTYNQKQAF